MKLSLRFPLAMSSAVIALLFVTPLAWGQAATGRVFGTVTDQQRSSVPGATVIVTNEATQVSKTTTTSDEGYFEVLDLPIGTYTVTVEHQGFIKYETSDNKLLINQSLKFEITLKIGTPTQTVTVESQATQVETENPTLGQSVTSRPIVDLPLDGRNVLNLALLQPGVSETNSEAQTLGEGSFNVAGGRADSVTYLLDGGLNNEIQGNGIVLNPNPDTIAEFRILTSDYTAEYGRNGGGIISFVTKSGTNQIHGSAFEFARNTDFNANSFFNKIATPTPLPRDDLKRHQFGGTFGGPITIPHLINGRDRFFFFLSYQGQRLTETAVQSQVTTFTPAELRGDFSQSVNGGPDPNVAAFLQANPYFETPNGNAAQAIIDPTKINPAAASYISLGLIPTSPQGLITTGAKGTNNNNEITGKADFNISQKDKLSATIGGFRNPELAPFGTSGANVAGFPSTDQTNNYFANVAYTRTFSASVLNELRFTAQRKYFLGDQAAVSLPSPAKLGFGITPDFPDGPPLLSFDNGLTLGISPQGPRHEVSNAFNASDTFTWVKGHNTWKFGAGFADYQNNTLYDFFGNGDFSFVGPYSSFGIGTGNSFADFLVGIPNSLFEGPNAANNLRSKSTYGFFQDEWRLKSNFTLTLGIRYEYSTPKLDTAGRSFSVVPGDQSTRFPNAPLGLVFPGDKGAPRGVNFPDKDNFAPRFGFAWDPSNNGKMSIRGGFGIFYDVLKGEDNLQFNGAPPFYSETGPAYSCQWAGCGNPAGPGYASTTPYFSQPWTSGGFAASPFPSTPPTASTDFAASGFLPLDLGGGLFFVNPRLHTPYTYQYNLSIQREVARNLVAEVNYVGSSSKGLTSLVDTNPFTLGTTSRVLNVNQTNSNIAAFCSGFASGLGFTDPTSFCPFASLPEFDNVSFANYNSLEASLTKQVGDSRFFGTTYFTLAYTYQHSIDNASGFRNRTSQVPAYNIGQFRGSSDFDVTHRITLAGDWDLPFDRAWSSGPKRLTSGWALRPIFTWHTGFPLSVASAASFSFTSASEVPGPSGAGDEYLAYAVFAPGVNSITLYNPKSTPSNLASMCASSRCAWYFDPTAFSCSGSPCPIPSNMPYGLPRNFFRGPGLTNLDMTVAKTTQIKENVKIEFRVDAFNVFNHTEFANPDTNIFSGTFGQITQTANEPARDPADAPGGPRILQLALKLSF